MMNATKQLAADRNAYLLSLSLGHAGVVAANTGDECASMPCHLLRNLSEGVYNCMSSAASFTAERCVDTAADRWVTISFTHYNDIGDGPETHVDGSGDILFPAERGQVRAAFIDGWHRPDGR